MQLILTTAFQKTDDKIGTLGQPQGSQQWQTGTQGLMCKVSEMTLSLMEMNLDDEANRV